MEKHHILLKDQLIEYELTYKDIKSIYLKVEKGTLIIHAPFFTPLSFINKNIIKYSSFDLHKNETFKKRKAFF